MGSYFEPFGLDYNFRKSPTLEYPAYLRAAYGDEQPFSFDGENHKTRNALLSVLPIQKPHPPLWMMSRDPETLEFLAANCINTGNFLVFPREVAAPRYRKYLEDWTKAGWDRKPNIAYATSVYVDETDDKALDVALMRASRAYEGLLPLPDETFGNRLEEFCKQFEARGENPAAVMIPRYSIRITSWKTIWCLSAPRKRSPKNCTSQPPRTCSTRSWASSILRICPKTT